MELGNYLLSDNDIEECKKKINRLKNIIWIIEHKPKETGGRQDLPKSSDDNVADDWKLESKETETKEKKNRSDDMKNKQAKGDETKDMQKETKATEISDKGDRKETIVDKGKKPEQSKGVEAKDMQKETKGSGITEKKETIVDMEKSLNSQKVLKQRIHKKKLKEVT